MGKKIGFLFATAVLFAAGCAMRDPGVRPNDVRIMHQHDDGCGHYYHEGRWYYVMTHLHQVGCGHHYYNSIWNLNPPTPGFTTHIESCSARAAETPSQAPRERFIHPRDRHYHTYYTD